MAQSNRTERRASDTDAQPDQAKHGSSAAQERQHAKRDLPPEEPQVPDIPPHASHRMDSSTLGDEGGGW